MIDLVTGSVFLNLGAVVIGRNEGDRLVRCLNSIKHLPVVYVDSGSTDKSIEHAKSMGIVCVELDMSVPFTAARARNEGFNKLTETYPQIELVQFVDGDCELLDAWLQQAPTMFTDKSDVAVVCGRRKEKFPTASIYNQICDIEWNTPVGEASACGGDAIYRVSVFKQVDGFDPTFIAGEEPELCFRIREQGHKILRIDLDMTLHDADMHSFSQWWKRAKRGGYAFTLNALKHGNKNSEKYKKAELKSILAWTLLYCLFGLFALVTLSILPLLILIGLLVLQSFRMTIGGEPARHKVSFKTYYIYSFLTMVGKFPEALGFMKCIYEKQIGKQAKLIEYK